MYRKCCSCGASVRKLPLHPWNRRLGHPSVTPPPLHLLFQFLVAEVGFSCSPRPSAGFGLALQLRDPRRASLDDMHRPPPSCHSAPGCVNSVAFRFFSSWSFFCSRVGEWGFPQAQSLVLKKGLMSPAPKVESRLDTLDARDDACAASAPVFVSCVFDAVRERHDEVLLNLSATAGQLRLHDDIRFRRERVTPGVYNT